MLEKIAKIVRVSTIPPVLVCALATSLYIYDPLLIGGLVHYCALVFFLAVLPVLAYPLQPLIPHYKHKGREGQRTLAFIASVAGYLCGIIFSLVVSAPIATHIIYWTYFISVIILTIFNKFTPWKASGHACGVAGPICAFIYFIGPKTLPVVLIFVIMAWASLKIKRHTLIELVLGGISSVTAFLIVLLAVNIIA